MASYPTAVKAFTTRNPGDVIQPAHVNDLQDEVNAIEAGLLNGTANLNSSHTTCATLSVTGGSTFAGTVNFTQSTVTFGNVLALAPAPSVCVQGATQNVVSGSTSPLVFATELWMTEPGMHSTAVTPSRLRPASTGLYHLSANVLWRGGSTGVGNCGLYFVIDGSSIIGQVSAVDRGDLIQNMTVPYYFRSTAQFAELVATQNSGSTKSVTLGGDYSPIFAMTKFR